MSIKIPQEVISCSNFINGEWVKGEAGTQDITSPYNGKKIGLLSAPSSAQIKDALKVASAAQVEWGKLPLKERAKVLFDFRNILLRDLDKISHIKSSESGKTFAEGK